MALLLPVWLVSGLLLWTLIEVVPRFLQLMDWRRWGRLLVLVLVLAAWYAPDAYGELRGVLQWVVAGGVVLGLLTMPRQTVTRVLTWVARVVADLRRFFRAFERPWQRLEVGVIVLAAKAMTLVTFLSVLHRNVTKLVGDTGVNRLGEVMNPSASSYLCVESLASDSKTKTALLDALSEGGSHPQLSALTDCMQAQVASGQQSVLVLWVILSLLLIFATERATVSQWKSLPLRLGMGVVIAAGFYGFCHGFVRFFPSISPERYKSLRDCCSILAFFGAAVAFEKVATSPSMRFVNRFPNGCSPSLDLVPTLGGDRLFLSRLVGRYQTWTDYIEWAENPALKIYPSIPIPYWTVQLAIPVGLGWQGCACLPSDWITFGMGWKRMRRPLAAAGIDVDQSELEAVLAERKPQKPSRKKRRHERFFAAQSPGPRRYTPIDTELLEMVERMEERSKPAPKKAPVGLAVAIVVLLIANLFLVSEGRGTGAILAAWLELAILIVGALAFSEKPAGAAVIGLLSLWMFLGLEPGTFIVLGGALLGILLGLPLFAIIGAVTVSCLFYLGVGDKAYTSLDDFTEQKGQ